MLDGVTDSPFSAGIGDFNAPDDNATAKTSTNSAQLWEVIIVAACPVIFVAFLCFCISAMFFKKLRNPPRVSAIERACLARVLRDLPPPPKYEIAVQSPLPPPLYSDMEKGVAYDPLYLFDRNSAHSSPRETNGGPTPLSIHYLYPPKYAKETPTTSKKSSSSTSSRDGEDGDEYYGRGGESRAESDEQRPSTSSSTSSAGASNVSLSSARSLESQVHNSSRRFCSIITETV